MSTTLLEEPELSLGNVASRVAAAKRRGDLQMAKSLLLSARCLPPQTVADELTLGFVNLQLGGFPAALDWFSRAAEKRPQSAFAHAGRALALQLLKRSPEAVGAAHRALELDPDQPTALKVLVRNAIDERRGADARAGCQRILTLNPRDPDAIALSKESEQIVAVDGLLGDFPTRTRTWQQLGPEHLLQQLIVGSEPRRVVRRSPPTPTYLAVDGFPVPPPDLRMGYATSEDPTQYLALGQASYDCLSGLLAKQGVALGEGDALLDWGCASGRALRNFINESRRGCAVWGGDVHAPSIEWAKNHLSPPFRFFNCSSVPHLPFADGTFKFIYALSVMTHIVTLRDMWLLELKRVLHPDGCAILTVHDEHTWAWFREHGMPEWMPDDLRSEPALNADCLDIQGSTWDQTYTFFHSDHIRRAWGQYFRVADIVPHADFYQAAVVLRKR